MYSKDGRKLSAATVKRIVAVVLSIVVIVATLAGCVPAATNGEGTADGETASTGMGGWTMIIYILVIVAVFYFLMIRPEKKKRKKAEDMRNSLSVGDSITTIGGMVGKIVNVSDEFITFETGEDRVRIKIAKWGISSTGKAAEEPTEKPDNSGDTTEVKESKDKESK